MEPEIFSLAPIWKSQGRILIGPELDHIPLLDQPVVTKELAYYEFRLRLLTNKGSEVGGGTASYKE